ncbi:hypothetical protein SFRURICE_007167 [Spodoptera frugiperda]|nr:hypothetical protein SFRURICE_007167 [Spodoptera frugiperda]
MTVDEEKKGGTSNPLRLSITSNFIDKKKYGGYNPQLKILKNSDFFVLSLNGLEVSPLSHCIKCLVGYSTKG